ncbi:membrane-spanning 4-domains subfamily A member 4D [Amia ocellicauda]|uniref:membrane-spanning 4-domains subfamily A member 4D n=1 Tax=Amia ocellicauda TaxID=2972642 RepID=UPI003463F433
MTAPSVVNSRQMTMMMTPTPAPGETQFSNLSQWQSMPNPAVGQAQDNLRRFLKGEPKALGTVQIMIAIMVLLIGVIQLLTPCQIIVVISGIPFWGAIFYIISGSLSVAVNQNSRSHLIAGAIAMNIISSIVASIGIILYALEMVLINQFICQQSSYISNNVLQGVNGVMLVLSLLEFCIAISISAFGCKATCNQSPVSIVIVQQVSTNQLPQAPVQNWAPEPLPQSHSKGPTDLESNYITPLPYDKNQEIYAEVI